MKSDSQRLAKGETDSNPLENYRAVVVGGHLDWPTGWIEKLTTYMPDGGTISNAAQSRGIPEQLLGVHFTNATAESDSAKCARESDRD